VTCFLPDHYFLNHSCSFRYDCFFAGLGYLDHSITLRQVSLGKCPVNWMAIDTEMLFAKLHRCLHQLFSHAAIDAHAADDSNKD
jgi:hypothetical protein